jgi:hypothetical protein
VPAWWRSRSWARAEPWVEYPFRIPRLVAWSPVANSKSPWPIRLLSTFREFSQVKSKTENLPRNFRRKIAQKVFFFVSGSCASAARVAPCRRACARARSCRRVRRRERLCSEDRKRYHQILTCPDLQHEQRPLDAPTSLASERAASTAARKPLDDAKQRFTAVHVRHSRTAGPIGLRSPERVGRR